MTRQARKRVSNSPYAHFKCHGNHTVLQQTSRRTISTPKKKKQVEDQKKKGSNSSDRCTVKENGITNHNQ
jgi:hypothetical protein